jgi:glycosyltransferase involved in cell wall biosynthesis
MTARVAIDVRILEHAGIGTYIRNLVPRVIAARPDWHFTLLASRPVPAEWRGPNVSVVSCTSRIYTAREQLELPLKTRGQLDLFWSPHYNIPLLISAPLVVTVHDVCHLALPELFDGVLKQWYARSLFAAVRKRADEIIFDSEFSRAEFTRFVGTPRRSTTIHLGVAESWSVANGGPPPHAKPYVLFIGSARPHKNLATLLRAFALVAASIPHDLVIVGGLSNQRTADSSIHALIAQLGTRVRVLEDIDDAALVGVVAHTDALVMPSLYEGFGLPALEAMAAGCPCLVSSAASLPEVCGDAAVFFDPRDPADIARQLTRVLGDTAMRANLAAAGRARAAEFRWESTAERTVAVLDRTLGVGR